MRVCDTHEKCAKYAVSALCAEKKVRATGECAHTLPSQTQQLPLRGCEPHYKEGTNLYYKKTSLHDHLERIPSDFSQVLLISSTRTWSISLLSTNRQMYE